MNFDTEGVQVITAFGSPETPTLSPFGSHIKEALDMCDQMYNFDTKMGVDLPVIQLCSVEEKCEERLNATHITSLSTSGNISQDEYSSLLGSLIEKIHLKEDVQELIETKATEPDFIAFLLEIWQATLNKEDKSSLVDLSKVISLILGLGIRVSVETLLSPMNFK